MINEGKSIILITHKLKEVKSMSDRVTVIRRGKVIDGIDTKDADTMQCPAGHLAITKHYEKRANARKNDRIKYYFDIEKCKCCPLREGCYKNTNSKSYSITIKSDYHLEQKEFQNTGYFKTRMKERYKIEAKNSELKGVHGYDQCDSAGLDSMQIQGAVTIFVANIKRILRLKGEVCQI